MSSSTANKDARVTVLFDEQAVEYMRAKESKIRTRKRKVDERRRERERERKDRASICRNHAIKSHADGTLFRLHEAASRAALLDY